MSLYKSKRILLHSDTLSNILHRRHQILSSPIYGGSSGTYVPQTYLTSYGSIRCVDFSLHERLLSGMKFTYENDEEIEIGNYQHSPKNQKLIMSKDDPIKSIYMLYSTVLIAAVFTTQKGIKTSIRSNYSQSELLAMNNLQKVLVEIPEHYQLVQITGRISTWIDAIQFVYIPCIPNPPPQTELELFNPSFLTKKMLLSTTYIGQTSQYISKWDWNPSYGPIVKIDIYKSHDIITNIKTITVTGKEIHYTYDSNQDKGKTMTNNQDDTTTLVENLVYSIIIDPYSFTGITAGFSNHGYVSDLVPLQSDSFIPSASATISPKHDLIGFIVYFSPLRKEIQSNQCSQGSQGIDSKTDLDTSNDNNGDNTMGVTGLQLVTYQSHSNDPRYCSS